MRIGLAMMMSKMGAVVRGELSYCISGTIGDVVGTAITGTALQHRGFWCTGRASDCYESRGIGCLPHQHMGHADTLVIEYSHQSRSFFNVNPSRLHSSAIWFSALFLSDLFHIFLLGAFLLFILYNFP